MRAHGGGGGGAPRAGTLCSGNPGAHRLRRSCSSGEKLGHSHAEARHGVTQVERLSGTVDVRIALPTVDGGRLFGGVEHEHRGRAGGKPFERLVLVLYLVKGIAGRDSLYGEAWRLGPVFGRPAD